MYHRIDTPTTDARCLCVSPEHFREHLEVLTRHYLVMPLRELAEQCQRGTAPNNAVALTFDDGYRDNSEVAYPLLATFGTPATLFITPGRLEGQRDYWWDELERIVLREPLLPPCLALRLDCGIREWRLDDWDRVDPTLQRGNTSGARQGRKRLFMDLHHILLASSQQEQLNIQDQLVSWAGSTNAARVPVLSREQVALLGENRLIEIGAHSVGHPMLTRLALAEQVVEMRKSREWLESVTEKRVTSFAYPYGDYDRSSVQAAGIAGFELACSCNTARVSRRTHLLALPRIIAHDVDGEEFTRALRRL